MSSEGNGIMGRIKIDVELANNVDLVVAEAGHISANQVRRVRLESVVDTGSNYLVLPKKVAEQLRLHSAGTVAVKYADKRKARRPLVDQVYLELMGRNGVFKAIVEPQRTTALLGAIVLEDLDLLVDCATQRLLPRDPTQYTAEVE